MRTVRPFTALGASERHSRRDSSRLDCILRNMSEGCLELDARLRCRYVNRAAATLFDVSAERILGRTPWDLFTAPIAGRIAKRLRAVLQTAKCATFEEYCLRQKRWIEVRAESAGNSVLVFLKDVSERHRMVNAARHETERWREIEERFQAALSVTQLVVFKMDRNLTYSWIYNNQVGVSDLDGIGKTPHDFFDQATASQFCTFLQSVVDSGKSRRMEVTLRLRKAMDTRHFVTSAKPVLAAGGEVVGLTGASIDITTLVRQKEELAQAREEAFLAKAEAERASLAKSKFLAAASHDLRQPVQSLLLLISVLKGQLAGSPSEKVAEQMDAAVDALRMLFDSMLDVSRLDAGVIVPELRAVRLSELLSRLAQEYRLRAQDRGLQFRLVAGSAVSRTDPVLVERALRNLLENALRYCTKGRILLGCRRQGRSARIEVWDTGIGIAPEHFEDVFEEFHQVGNAARDRSRGLGLGLSIVKRIMRILGGTVELRSAVGRGSCFALTLPLTDVAVADNGAAVLGAEGGGRHVLVVEDDTLLRNSLLLMMRDWGYQAEAAASGEEALAKVAAGCRPDAIVSDYRLGTDLNGIRTILEICRMVENVVPSLIITGDTDPERVREVHGSGLRILHKPVAAEDLRRALLTLHGDSDRGFGSAA